MGKAVGILEIAGIAPGYLLANEINKHTAVDVLQAGTICPGNFLMIISGDTASVATAMELVQTSGAEGVISHGMLANIDQGVVQALVSPRSIPLDQAMGIVETLAITPAILAADGAVKAASVELIDVRIAGGMAGKALVVFAGAVDAVQAALAHVAQLLDPEDLASAVLLASPHPELLAHWQ
mgnify:FL=1